MLAGPHDTPPVGDPLDAGSSSSLLLVLFVLVLMTAMFGVAVQNLPQTAQAWQPASKRFDVLACDANRNHRVEVNEIIQGVNALLEQR